MLVCIVASAIFVFGLSMLARRASATYAFIGASLAIVPVAIFVLSALSTAGPPRAFATRWSPTLLLVPVIYVVQARALATTPDRTIAGLVADLGLGFLWIGGLAFFEMLASGDGGPGFGQYIPIVVLTFFASELLLPLCIAKAIPKRASLPPRVARPGDYPRS